MAGTAGEQQAQQQQAQQQQAAQQQQQQQQEATMGFVAHTAAPCLFVLQALLQRN
jgi:hypothetical protein